jgi:transcriptional regulator with XRE-family HTH domain
MHIERRCSMRSALPREELTRRTKVFLTKAFKNTKFSRKEAAERGNVSESYLTGLLAGRAVAPGLEILRAMAAGWGFNILDFYANLGWIADQDVVNYVQRNKLMENAAPADMKMVYDRAMALPTKTREKVVLTTILPMLDIAAQGNGD